MEFSELYKNNKSEVEKRIASLWCTEANNEAQQQQAEELKDKISSLFAPEDAVPVVQCMNSYKSVEEDHCQKAESLVGDLWRKTLPEGKYWPPYQHQYDSWQALLKETHKDEETGDEKPMSICVTTGTGSGKTECFMMPLVHDLEEYNKKHDAQGLVQAIFLYPLNALMEDQKDRLEKMLDGRGLTYAVYNGDLPETEPTKGSKDYEKEMRKIYQLRGLITDEDGNCLDKDGKITTNEEEYTYKYPNMLYTRQQVRSCPPNILLTNPTMLEYILLRKKDEKLINAEAKSLRWVAIDETHTYTGAGATELAMLLRRVMIAFGMDAKDVRFATSSATFTNVPTDIPEDEQKELQKEADDKLKEFISDLTGTGFNQVKVISGKRDSEELLKDANLPEEDKQRWTKICKEDYVALIDENKGLFKDGTIEERLKDFDEMCARIEALKQNDSDRLLMKAKVHYFYRVPNRGLYVRLNETTKEGRAFKLYTEKPIEQEEGKLPLLELSRCECCGEYVAVGLLDEVKHELSVPMSDDSDMFDLGEEGQNDHENEKQVVFALSNTEVNQNDHTGIYEIDGNKVQPPLSTSGSYRPNEWHLIGNSYKECPCCNAKLTRKTSNNDEDNDEEEEIEDYRLRKFRLSSEFVSRMLASPILDQLEEVEPKKNVIALHKGQQYISFVDSRQAAAKSALNQNVEQERLWFYSTIFHELTKRRRNVQNISVSIENKKEEIRNLEIGSDAWTQATLDLKELQGTTKDYMTWNEIADLFYIDKEHCDDKFMIFCQRFVKHRDESEDIDSNTGEILEYAKKRYLYSLMLMYLGNHPVSAASPETMGLFHPVYPFLKDMKVPEDVNKFNALIKNEENKIGDKDWQNLIQVFLDYIVRSKQSFFLNMGERDSRIDIFACNVRYATEKKRRRNPVTKPKYEKQGDVSNSRIVRMLSGLIARDRGEDDNTQIQKDHFDEISAVVNALWSDLETNKIIEKGTHYDKDQERQVDDRKKQADDNNNEVPKWFNLSKLCFKLYDEVYLCDTNTKGGVHHVERMRPIENNFKKFSPYLIGNKAVNLGESETWKPYDMEVSGNRKNDFDELQKWAKENRSILWSKDNKSNIWGPNGTFADRLNDIYLKPDLFIEAEHTAQVDKSIARTLQSDFKDHTINILACSTTMEMGVDLGDLEVVMLTSVPPHPANYKQRAGRSGRNNKVKSVCITLCGSDAIGLRTLTKPIETIISRPVDVPAVDFNSKQVVIRHVNSYLIRAFGVFDSGDNGGSLMQKVLDFYTPFKTKRDSHHNLSYFNEKDEPLGFEDGLGADSRTKYMNFDRACGGAIESWMKTDLCKLLKKTPYASNNLLVLKIAREENVRCYKELYAKVDAINQAWQNADPKSKENGSYRNLLDWEYREILLQTLLSYWPTNRFTPNANMPVNVISLDLKPSYVDKDYARRGSSDPSYTLRDALQQYVPGNSLIVDGVAYIVRGVSTSGDYSDSKPYKQLYHNYDRTVIGEDPTMDGRQPWSVNGQTSVTLVQPQKYLPDPNEECSRHAEDNIYTRVSAQLIGANSWGIKITEPYLFSTRRSDNSGNARILYYNEGIGYGYALCTKCRKMTLEHNQVDLHISSIPREIDNRESSKGTRYHYAIDKAPKTPCFGSGKKDYVKRNVIIGDTMQTDYCEIKLRHKNTDSWITFITTKPEENEKNKSLIVTLGIVFCQALVELKGWERNAVDFAVMPNMHLCIFDTNPGGAGYSVVLDEIQTMLDVIKCAESILKKAKEKGTKDMLLDKFTLRYLDDIDIDGALEWIADQDEAKGVLPDPIPTAFENCNVNPSSRREMEKTIASSIKESVIFADDKYEKWKYGTADEGWQGRFLGEFFENRSRIRFCVVGDGSKQLPEPIRENLDADIRSMFQAPKICVNEINERIYPLAYVDGHLYFTLDEECASLNEYWADGVIYCVKTENNPATDAIELDCKRDAETTQIFFFDNKESEKIKSSKLGKCIHNYDDSAKRIIDKFLDNCNGSDGELKITYQDEHLKSVGAIILILQTIEYFAVKINKKFSLEFLLEEYYCENQSSHIFANLENSSIRNEILEKNAGTWLSYMENEKELKGQVNINTNKKRSLEHWRVLILECNGKRISIYPDGGILNGWSLDTSECKKYYDLDTSIYDNLPLVRKETIKFDVKITDV